MEYRWRWQSIKRHISEDTQRRYCWSKVPKQQHWQSPWLVKQVSYKAVMAPKGDAQPLEKVGQWRRTRSKINWSLNPTYNHGKCPFQPLSHVDRKSKKTCQSKQDDKSLHHVVGIKSRHQVPKIRPYTPWRSIVSISRVKAGTWKPMRIHVNDNHLGCGRLLVRW